MAPETGLSDKSCGQQQRRRHSDVSHELTSVLRCDGKSEEGKNVGGATTAIAADPLPQSDDASVESGDENCTQ